MAIPRAQRWQLGRVVVEMIDEPRYTFGSRPIAGTPSFMANCRSASSRLAANACGRLRAWDIFTGGFSLEGTIAVATDLDGDEDPIDVELGRVSVRRGK